MLGAYNSAWATNGNGNGSGRAKIWLSIPGSTYIGSDPDPWLRESDLTTNPNFTLNVQNTANNPIYDAHLVLAIPGSTSSSNLWSIKINDTFFHYADFSHTGGHTYLSPHGVLEGATKWTEYNLGNLAANSLLGLSISNLPTSGLSLHFDAYGSSSATSQNGWYFAPYSHDANYTPEPVSAALFLLGGGALLVRKFRKRK